MQLSQVRYFIQASRLLNFTKAADVCCVSQPALTKGVKALEDELGGPLFHRSPKLCLTDLGRRVLPFLEQTFEAANAVRQQAQSYRNGEQAPISVGFDPSVPAAVIAPILAELNRALPGFTMQLNALNAETIVDALMDGDIDIAVRAHDNSADRHPIHHLPLASERLAVVCGRGHAFAQANAVDVEALLAAPDRIAYCATADKLLAGLGGAQPARHRASTPEQLALLLDMGAGWALTPADDPLTHDRVSRDLEGSELTRLVEVIYPAGRPHGSAVSAFIRLARMGKRPAPVTAA